MTLYLSNPTKQHRVFHYRTEYREDSSAPQHADIPSGGQIALGQGWNKEQLATVLTQLHRMGARPASETHGHMPKFLSLIYSLDFPVDSGEIEMAHAEVVKAQEERSVAQAQRGALAFDRNTNNRGRGSRRIAKVTEVEVVELKEPGARRTGDEVEFSMSVDPDGRSDISLPV